MGLLKNKNNRDKIDDLVAQYNSVLGDLLEIHAPLITKKITSTENGYHFHFEYCTTNQIRELGLHIAQLLACVEL